MNTFVELRIKNDILYIIYIVFSTIQTSQIETLTRKFSRENPNLLTIKVNKHCHTNQ